MEIKVIDYEDREILTQAVRLHYECLSYRSFITLFGLKFLYHLYATIVKQQEGFLIVSNENGRLGGFVFACKDSTRLIRILSKRFFVFVPSVLKTLIIKPSVAKNFLETIFYSGKDGAEVKPELMVIAVDENMRSKGLGAKLIRHLNAEFTKRGITQYKVTVHKEMERSNKFYISNGMKLINNFTLYGHVWNVYLNKIG